MTREEQIDLLRTAADKLVAAGLGDTAADLSDLASDLQCHPFALLNVTDTQLYLARTVDDFVSFARIVEAGTQ